MSGLVSGRLALKKFLNIYKKWPGSRPSQKWPGGRPSIDVQVGGCNEVLPTLSLRQYVKALLLHHP